MRWNELFADLEGQAAAEESGDLAAEVADRSRYEAGQLPLLERIRLLGGAHLHVGLVSGRVLGGPVVETGANWLIVHQGRSAFLVPEPSLAWLGPGPGLGLGPGPGLGLGSAPRLDHPTLGSAGGEVARRLTMGHPLRRLARDRAVVVVELVAGGVVSGTIDRVGADHLDLAEHAPEEPRRPSSVRSIRLLAFRAIASIASSASSASSASIASSASSASIASIGSAASIASGAAAPSQRATS